MEETTKVTVIVPVYNAGKYLEQSLESVLAQSLKRIEIICINDGSTDNSADILYKYEKKYKNIFIISTSNHGAGFARNLGLRLAKGETVSFLDPDDYYPNGEILEKLYAQMAAHHVDICGGSAVMLRGDEIRTPSEKNRKYTFERTELRTFKDYQWSYGFWRFLYSRRFLLEHGVCFPNYRRYQDPPFLVKAMAEAGSFLSVPDVSYVYRENIGKRDYSYIETRDALKGIIDVLELTYKNQLAELNQISVEHIDTWLSLPILKGILEGHEELPALLDKARGWVYAPKALPASVYRFQPERRLLEYREAKTQERKLLSQICRYEKLILYGIGEVGKQFLNYIISHSLPITVLLAVTHRMEETPVQYHGIEIKELWELENQKKEALVLVTTKAPLHREMEKQLLKYEYPNYDFIDYDRFLLYSIKLEERTQ